MADDIKIVGLSSKKAGGTNWKVISAIIGIVVLSIGVIAGIMLVRQNQNIEEKALECSAGGSMCPDPNNPSLLRDCSTGETFPNDSLCDIPGEVEVCGTTASNAREYCCPSAGGAWTTNMSQCACDAKAPTGLSTANLTSTTVTLKWTGATGGKLRLWVSKNADLSCNGTDSCPANDLTITPSTTSEYPLTNLLPDTKYYWRVMAWTKSGCDSGSAVMDFTTSTNSQVVATATTTTTATATSSSTAVATATSTSTSTSKTATPTATSTTKATATSTGSSKTSTPTSKANSTATAKATGSATAFPVPETGAEWPTVIGAGFGIIMLLVSLALAL